MEYSGYVYTCTAGETFDSVALVQYGNEKYAVELMTANPDTATKTVFTGGEVLILPVVTVPNTNDEPANVPETAPWK